MNAGVDAGARVLAGRYRLGPQLGRGGMAEVYDAYDERLGRPVAVKLLRADMVSRPEVRSRFTLEARAAASLSHPNVVAVFDTGEDDDGTAFLVMERLPGETLADRMVAGPLEPAWVVRMAGDVLGALGAAHGAGIIHRDVKPGNILLSEDGCAKVADFGIAKGVEAAAAGDATTTGMLLGTPAYLAPEQLDGERASVQSDLYALGVVLYEALAGRKPFAGDTPVALAYAVQHADPEPLAALCPGLDPRVLQVVERAMARVPGDRFASAEEMADALGVGVTAAGPDPTMALSLGATGAGAIATARAARPRTGVHMPPIDWRRLLVPALVAAGVLVLLLVLAAARGGPRPGTGSGDAGLAGELRELAGRVETGDGPRGPELADRLRQVAGHVEAGRADAGGAATALLGDLHRWQAERAIGTTAYTRAVSLLGRVPGVDRAAVTPATTAPPPTMAPPPDDDDGGDRGKGKKGKGDDD